MAEATATAPGDAERAASGKKGLLKNKKVLAGLGALVLLGGGGGAAFVMMGSEAAPQAQAVEEAVAKPSVYLDLPEMVVNLSSPDGRNQYLKIRVSLEADAQTSLDALQPVMPRVLDLFQIYLRELRISDLQGSAGLFRLKEELHRRVNLAIAPHKVTRVLFKEVVVQ